MTDMSWNPNKETPVPESSDGVRRELRIGAAVAGLFFVGLLGWAALTPLDAGAYAEGVVAVAGNRQAVQHREGGIVTHIAVSEGALVKKGDILLRISASELLAAERGVSGETVALLAQRSRLLAERDGLSEIALPLEFAALTPADQALAAEALRGQRLLFDTRRRSLQTETGVLRQRMRQHAEQIGGYGHQLEANRVQQRLIGDELSGLRPLAASGFVSTNRVRAMERAAAELQGNHGSYQADVARSTEAIGEARLQIVATERHRMEEVAAQLRDAQVRLDELQPKLVAMREQIERSIVRAPAGGKVVGLKVFTVGGVVGAGDTLMEIVPQDRALVIEGRVSPSHADDLVPGMETQVRFSSLQERNLPILFGKLSRISADSFQDERTGQSFFRIEVVVPPPELDKLRTIRSDGGLRAGLPADVMIPLRKRSALTYLVEPIVQTLWLAGREH